MPPLTPPPSVLADVDDVLASLGPDRRLTFRARLDRWWPDLLGGLVMVHGDEAEAVAGRLVRVAAHGYLTRDDDLHELDLRRTLEPDWFASPRMVGYAAYTERFAGDLRGVASRLDHLRSLGVTYLHLMPLLTPREGDSDGGYAVADYRTVRSDLGTNDDLRELARALRGNGVSLVLDLVLNHVAAEHEWARRARAGEQRYLDYFHTYADRAIPDAYERTLPEVFPDFAPGSFTWDEELGRWVWTTFNSFQWDLDWSNQDVLVEFAEIVLHLANLGVEVLRLDAIAFLWKRMGTTCQGQPEVHALTQVLRAVARIAAPAVAFKAEAIVAPHELMHYLGRGRFTGKVSDLAYHNSLMVQTWSMLATGDARLAAHALSQLPVAPSTSAFITYVRCHDDIGWAVSDEDAAAVGLDGHAHRAFLSEWYSGEFPGSGADGLVFQHNPATGDRRISGTAASLLGIGGSTDETDRARRLAALRLAHALAYGWGGVPVIWSGDELATPNDEDWQFEEGHEGDNRWAGRPRLSECRLELARADVEREAHGQTVLTEAGRALVDLRHLAAVRRRLPHLHASVATRVGPVDDPGVLVTVRDHPLGVLVGLHNVSDTWRPWSTHRLHELGLGDGHRVVDALTAVRADGTVAGGDVWAGQDGHIWLAPYDVLWLVDPATIED